MRCVRYFLLLWIVLTVVSVPVSAEDARAMLEKEIDPEAGLSGEVLQGIGAYDGAVDGLETSCFVCSARRWGRSRSFI